MCRFVFLYCYIYVIMCNHPPSQFYISPLHFKCAMVYKKKKIETRMVGIYITNIPNHVYKLKLIPYTYGQHTFSFV